MTRFYRVLSPILLCLYAALAAGHETDQFTLPVGRQFADLGPYVTECVYEDVVEAVTETNRAIESSLANGQATPDTARFTSGDYVAREVWSNLYDTFPTNELVDAKLHSEAFRANYPGLLTAYRAEAGIYDHPGMLIDVTKFVRTFFRASTVNIDGTLVGTDKLIHFINLGRIYYANFFAAVERGVDHDQAVADAIRLSAGSNPFLSEGGFLGSAATGIYSNADLAANYAGFKFLRNLTEEIDFDNQKLPPMLVRDGHYWRVGDHVTPYSDFFVRFVTPHWNEAINHNRYTGYMRGLLRQLVGRRCPDLLDWYRTPRGERRGRQQFVELNDELSTLFGEPYGWQNDAETAVSIANVCFEEDQQDSATGSDQRLVRQTAEAPLGRTELWWAASNGRMDDVISLLGQGADPGAPDRDGETPLHAAARWGHTRVAAALLESGADVSPGASHETTPLHLSIRERRLDTARLLLESGADVNAQDAFGITPLHEAARRDDPAALQLLMVFDADTAIADNDGVTPLDIGKQAAHRPVSELLAAGSEVAP